MSQPRNEILRGFSVLFCDHALIFDRLLTVFLALLLVATLTRHRAEDSRCGEDLIEVLELLAGALLVAIAHGLVVDFLNVGEAVDDESSQQNRVRNFVSLDRERH